MSIHILTIRILLGEYEKTFEEAERVRDRTFQVQIGTHVGDFVLMRESSSALLAQSACGATAKVHPELLETPDT